MASNYPKTVPLNRQFMNVHIEDISTEGQRYFRPGFRGKVKNIHAVISDAITNADAELTFKIGGTAITGSAITIVQSESAEGDAYTSTPTAANFFTATDTIEVETDGGSTGTVAAVVTFEMEVV